MGISLKKGQKVDLTKTNPGLKNVIVGLGWDANANIDLDASAFLLNSIGKVKSDQDLIFYNNPIGGQNAVVYSGDKRSGIGNTDAEQIKIDLLKVPPNIERIAFTITIYDANARRQSFGQVQNAYVRIFDEHSNNELLRFDLGRDFSVETAIVVAELYRHASEWKFNAIGSGFSGGLGSLCKNFGVTVDEDIPQNTNNNFQSNNNAYSNPSQNNQYNNQYNNNQNSNPYNDPYNNNHYNNPNNAPYNNNQNNYNNNNNNYNDSISCPRCKSTHITSGKKGFGIGKAAIGGLLLGPVGLLGGFIGGNQLSFTCISCGNKWSFNQSDYTGWINEQKNKAKELFHKYKSQDVLDAVVASCALVAMADGYLDPSEKQKMLEFVNQSQELRVFDLNLINTRFNHFIMRLGQDPIIGKAEALRAVGAIRNKPDIARLVARYCVAIGFADGNFDPTEQQMLTEICRELYLNPSEFLY